MGEVATHVDVHHSMLLVPASHDEAVAVHPEEEEEDVCRICRMPSEQDNPLFYPCKCSGTIKYVHQQCLVQWLNHSGNSHCEVCKYRFSFTPVYAKDTPVILPWHELILGILRRVAKCARVAHRIWAVCSIWLFIVPLCTCFAWRVSLVESVHEVPQILARRCNVVALLADCLQGSLLSICIVFLNMSFSSLKDYLKQCIQGLEQQVLRTLPAETPTPTAAHNSAGATQGQLAPPDAAEQQLLASEERELEDRQQQPEAAAAPPLVLQAFAAPRGDQQQVAHDAGDEVDGDELIAAAGDEFANEPPFEELIGLQGSWLTFLETIVVVLISNAFFMFLVVWIPLNIGRIALRFWLKSLEAIHQTHPLGDAFLASVSSALVTDAIGAALGPTNAPTSVDLLLTPPLVLAPDVLHLLLDPTAALAPMAALAMGQQSAAGNASLLAAANAAASYLAETAAAAAGVAAVTVPGMLSNRTSPGQSLGPLAVTLEQMLRDVQAHLDPPRRGDLLALGLGHCFLTTLAFAALWLYVSMRLWRAHARRACPVDRRSAWQLVRATSGWAAAVLQHVGKVVKLGCLLVVELGVFPVLCGFWLDLCLLPITAATAQQRIASLHKAPLMSAFMHWMLGVAFMLGFTLLMCMVREVLRPGALPFLKDPTNPERNPIRDMMEEPLTAHLTRVGMSGLLYAALCVTLVHFPALLAKAAMPSLFPLRLHFLDPLTQIPADMLLFHVFIPFTMEHVKIRAMLKACTRRWLGLAGRVLGLTEYLLPPARQPAEPAAPPAAAPVAADLPQAEAANAAVEGAVGEEVAAEGLAVRVPEQAVTAAASEAAPAASEVADKLAATSSPALAAPTGESAEQPDDVSTTEAHGPATPDPTVELPPVAPVAAQVGGPPEAGQPPPLAFFETQPGFPMKLLMLALMWAGTMVVLDAFVFVLPVSLGRLIFLQLGLPFKNDLYTIAVGLYTIWGSISCCRSIWSVADARSIHAALKGACVWGLVLAKCLCLGVLWLGVVACMVGMLVDLALLPLQLAPNQSPVISIYQDWTLGVLALKLWHLVIVLAPRREGIPLAEGSWQAHFDAIQRDGLRNINFVRALTAIVLPAIAYLAAVLAAPALLTRVLLPMLHPPPQLLQYACLYAHTVAVIVVALWTALRRLRKWLAEVHNTIRDDRYLVGRELNNFEAAAAAAAAAAEAAALLEASAAEEAQAAAAASTNADVASGSSVEAAGQVDAEARIDPALSSLSDVGAVTREAHQLQAAV